jgi:threonine dehydratase
VENLSAKVVMQTSANPFRISLAKTFGAEIIMKEGGVATFAEADKLMREERRTFIHPFDGLDTTLGAAGVGLELIEDYSELDAVVVAVGGGGLISGVAAVKLKNSKCKVYGVEPLGANSMSQSMVVNKPVTLDSVNTIADSLAPPMALPFGYSVCKKYVDQFVTVTDDQICAGLSLLQEECKLAVEPAAGAVLAGVIWPLRKQLVGKKIGLIICGANIDAQSYGRFLKQGYEKLKAEF